MRPGHAAQADDPEVEVTVFPGHVRHDVEPALLEKVPGLHGAHTLSPLDPIWPYVPGTQATQASMLVAPTVLSSVAVPNGHLSHDIAPVVLLNVDARQ